MNNRLYQSLYQSIPVLPVYTSLYRVHLAARITSVFTLTRPARDAVKLGIPYCIHAPIHTPPRNRTARATRPRNRGNVFLHASAAPSGAAAPLHRRASGWRAVLPRGMHMVRLDSCFKTSNVPPRSDRIIVRGVGVAATRQRSRFPIRRAFQCAHPPNELPLAVGPRAPQPEAPPIHLCALIDGPLSVFGHGVRGDTTPMAAGALPGCRRPAVG